MIILHVTYTAKPGEGMARKFVEELEQGPALKVRAEKGNICYVSLLSLFYFDIITQLREN